MSAITSLEDLPVELVIDILSSLPTFSDVFAFSSTCHSLRNIWIQNAHIIANSVASRSISCVQDAYCLLAVQTSDAPYPQALSASRARQMVRNANHIEKLIARYNEDVEMKLWRAEVMTTHLRRDYRSYPRSLTPTERRRFIGSYYQYCAMALLGPDERQHCIQQTSLKRLLIWQDFGDEQYNVWNDYIMSGGRVNVELPHKDVRHRISEVCFTRTHASWTPGSEMCWVTSRYWQPVAAPMFDWFQKEFKNLLVGQEMEYINRWYPILLGEAQVWYDTSDEEEDWVESEENDVS